MLCGRFLTFRFVFFIRCFYILGLNIVRHKYLVNLCGIRTSSQRCRIIPCPSLSPSCAIYVLRGCVWNSTHETNLGSAMAREIPRRTQTDLTAEVDYTFFCHGTERREMSEGTTSLAFFFFFLSTYDASISTPLSTLIMDFLTSFLLFRIFFSFFLLFFVPSLAFLFSITSLSLFFFLSWFLVLFLFLFSCCSLFSFSFFLWFVFFVLFVPFLVLHYDLVFSGGSSAIIKFVSLIFLSLSPVFLDPCFMSLFCHFFRV